MLASVDVAGAIKIFWFVCLPFHSRIFLERLVNARIFALKYCFEMNRYTFIRVKATVNAPLKSLCKVTHFRANKQTFLR